MYYVEAGAIAGSYVLYVYFGVIQWYATTSTDEARIHLRDRPGDDSDRAALDASLRFSRGLGAKSSCKVKKILSEDEELLLEKRQSFA
jgi:hypothetical protein